MNYVTKKYVNILHLTWESPTRLWTFKVLMRADETRNSLNGEDVKSYINKEVSFIYNICTTR